MKVSSAKKIKNSTTTWKWTQDPEHVKTFLDAYADQVKLKYGGILDDVPNSFSIEFAKWFAPISYYMFGYGNGISWKGIKNQAQWIIDKQPINRLGKRVPYGLFLRTKYRAGLQHRGITIEKV